MALKPSSPPPPPRVPSSTSALDVLRESARILRHNSSPFLSALFLLICPSSAFTLLAPSLLPPRLSLLLSQHLSSLSALPPSTPLLYLSSHLSSSLLSSLSSVPLLLSSLLLARASVALSIARAYAHQPPLSTLPLAAWPRLALTYLCSCATQLSLLSLFLLILSLLSGSLTALRYPPDILALAAIVVVLAFSVPYAHTVIVCNLAAVISALEESSGFEALRRSLSLVKGQTRTGLVMFLVSTIGMAFVEGLFENRVRSLSYGDGSSRLWEGPLLVVMYSFVVLMDSMMSAVFYFACRSSSLEEMDGGVCLDGDVCVKPVVSVEVDIAE